jgi:hypothetical protein
MAKREQKGNRESKKPKKEKIKTSPQRRAKRARRRVGSRRSDQAKPNRNIGSQPHELGNELDHKN